MYFSLVMPLASVVIMTLDRQRMGKMDKKSPLKVRPLRNPGESGSNTLDDFFWDHIGIWMVAMTFGVLIAGYEWLRWATKMVPQPIPMTILAVGVVGLSVWKIRKAIPLARQLRQGIDGEKLVGQCLEALGEQGYRVIHDIEGDGFNIDHVLIGPTGVFAVETKTHSKPAKGKCEILYDGTTVLVNGLAPDRDPVVQAKASAQHVASLLEQCTGRKVPVRPVVLFAGWYVRRRARKVEVWVLNEEYLQAYLDHEDQVLTTEQVHSLYDALATHVRAQLR